MDDEVSARVVDQMVNVIKLKPDDNPVPFLFYRISFIPPGLLAHSDAMLANLVRSCYRPDPVTKLYDYYVNPDYIQDYARMNALCIVAIDKLGVVGSFVQAVPDKDDPFGVYITVSCNTDRAMIGKDKINIRTAQLLKLTMYNYLKSLGFKYFYNSGLTAEIAVLHSRNNMVIRRTNCGVPDPLDEELKKVPLEDRAEFIEKHNIVDKYGYYLMKLCDVDVKSLFEKDLVPHTLAVVNKLLSKHSYKDLTKVTIHMIPRRIKKSMPPRERVYTTKVTHSRALKN